MRKYKTTWGEHIEKVIQKAIRVANVYNDTVEMEFNEKLFVFPPGDGPKAIYNNWLIETEAEKKAYLESPEYKKKLEAALLKRQAADELLAAELMGTKITITDQEGWDAWKAKNTDPYSARIFDYAETWARLMETQLDNGTPIADIAEKTSRIADNDGITGFMYGAAVSILAQGWKYGEELRRWRA